MGFPVSKEPMTEYNVRELLPHREPILLVDHVLDLEIGESIITERTFPEGDPVFEGHFPGNPIMPGMLTIEALAQTAGVLINITNEKTADESLFFFMSVDGVKFRRPVLPGMTIRFYATQIQKRGHVYKFFGIARDENGDKMAEATFTAKWSERTE